MPNEKKEKKTDLLGHMLVSIDSGKFAVLGDRSIREVSSCSE